MTGPPAASSATASRCRGRDGAPHPLPARAQPGPARPPDAARAGADLRARGGAPARGPPVAGAQPAIHRSVDPPPRVRPGRSDGSHRGPAGRPPSLMRATLHLTTAEDYLLLRPPIQAALDRSQRSIAGKDALRGWTSTGSCRRRGRWWRRNRAPSRRYRSGWSRLEPDRDPSALAYLVRMRLPLVQAPPAGTWGRGGSPRFALPEPWLGSPLADPDESLRALLFRYLAAFGPAGVKDFQTWSGLTSMKDLLEEMKPELRLFRDEDGRRALRPAGRAAAGGRYPGAAPLRARVRQPRAGPRRPAARHRRRGPQKGLSLRRPREGHDPHRRLRGRRVEDREDQKDRGPRRRAVRTPSRNDRDALPEEGERLIRFVGEGAGTFEVRFE